VPPESDFGSCLLPFACGDADAVDAATQPLTVVCRDGGVVADYAAAARAVNVEVDPPQPLSSLPFTVTVRAEAGADAVVTLDGLGSVASGDFTARPDAHGVAVFPLRATSPGAVELRATLRDTVTGGCAGNSFPVTEETRSAPRTLTIERGERTVTVVYCDRGAACWSALVPEDPSLHNFIAQTPGSTHVFDKVVPGRYTLWTESCAFYPPFDNVTLVVDRADLEVHACYRRLGEPAPTSCPMDCNGDDRTAVHEIVAAVAISLEVAPLAHCTDADVDGDGTVHIHELILGVGAAVLDCGAERGT
jgi:hypothetical protein